MKKNKKDKVDAPNCHCRCGYNWLSRGKEKPKACPYCKSYLWDKKKVTIPVEEPT